MEAAGVEAELGSSMPANFGKPERCHGGRNWAEKGSRSNAASIPVHTRCRLAAERFRSSSAIMEPRSTITVAFTAVSIIRAEIVLACILSTLLLRFRDHLAEILLFLCAETRVVHIQQRSHGPLRRSAEECLHKVLQGRIAHLAGVVRGHVHILETFLFVAQISFIFQQSKHAPD